MEPTRTTRRSFLAFTIGGVAVVGGVAAERILRGWPHSAVRNLADALRQAPDVTELGSEYLALEPDEADERALTSRLASTLRPQMNDSVATLATRLRAVLTREFEAGDTTRVGGWVFARSELALFALAALRSTAGVQPTALLAPEPEGLLEPEERDGRRVSWTQPEATLTVARGTAQLDLVVRSHAPFPQEISAQCDGADAGRISLPDQAWRSFAVRLPQTPANRKYFVVTLTVEPFWRPTPRGRALGVQMVENRWTR